VWSWPVITSLCTSVLALLVALGALVWQITSWRRSGPRVSVKAVSAATPEGKCIVIQATNAGRLATEVSGCGFDLPSGRHIVNPIGAFGPHAVPATLAPGGSVSFYFHPEGLRQPLTGEGISGEGVRPYVETGHGHVNGSQIHLGKMIDATT
jgi:hypothetical protein